MLVWFLITLFFSGFVFWRKLRRERVDDEDKLIDRLIRSLLFGLFFGRVIYVISHIAVFGLSLAKWITLQPFMVTQVVCVVSGLVFFYNSLGREWKDKYEILDYLGITLAFTLFLSTLGDLCMQSILLSESFFVHKEAFQAVIDYRALGLLFLLTIAYGALFVFLSKVEKIYRTFIWYRAKRRSAQTGFVISVFLIGYGLFGFLGGAELILKLLVVIGGFMLLYVRSGRSLYKRT